MERIDKKPTCAGERVIVALDSVFRLLYVAYRVDKKELTLRHLAAGENRSVVA